MPEIDGRALRRLSGADASTVWSLSRAGPLRYSFDDHLVVRTGRASRRANAPARKLHRAPAQGCGPHPPGTSLLAVSVTVPDNPVGVREGNAVWLCDAGLAPDPQFADAHDNLARRHDRAGRVSDPRRQMLAHRRLTNRGGA